MIETVYEHLTDFVNEYHDDYVNIIIYDYHSRDEIGELEFRAGNVSFSKFNETDIIIWHKGGPFAFIRNVEDNKIPYKKYIDIGVDNECIGFNIAMGFENGLYCIESNLVRNK